MEGYASHGLACADSDADDGKGFQQPNTDIGQTFFVRRVTGFVARIAKSHIGKARVGSEEHAPKGAHELSALTYQVDCVAERAQLLKHSYPFLIANRVHENGIRQIRAATQAETVLPYQCAAKGRPARARHDRLSGPDHRNAPLDGQFRNQLQTNFFR